MSYRQWERGINIQLDTYLDTSDCAVGYVHGKLWAVRFPTPLPNSKIFSF